MYSLVLHSRVNYSQYWFLCASLHITFVQISLWGITCNYCFLCDGEYNTALLDCILLFTPLSAFDRKFHFRSDRSFREGKMFARVQYCTTFLARANMKEIHVFLWHESSPPITWQTLQTSYNVLVCSCAFSCSE